MIKPFCKSGSERGSSLVEVLIATFIVGATAYYATTSVSQNMLAQKKVTAKDSIQVYEEAFRALVSKEIVRAAEGNPKITNSQTGCFQGKNLNNTLIGIEMAGDTEIQTMRMGINNPKEVVHNDGTDWAEAFSRCWTEQSWKLDLSKGHLHSCMQIKSTKRNTRGYAFAEVSFSLINLKTGQPFTKCSQFKNVNVANTVFKKGSTPVPAYCKNKWAKSLPLCKAKPGAATTIKTSFAEPPETKENDYTGNPNRGFRMLYTLYTKAPTQTGWQYSKASGEMFLGVNSHEDYCATRYGGNAKGPGEASGSCTYVGADTKYESKPNPEIDIAQDDMDKFFPPDESECYKSTKPACARYSPNGSVRPVDCTDKGNFKGDRNQHGACACLDEGSFKNSHYDAGKCEDYKEDVLWIVDCKRKPYHDACVYECRQNGNKSHCDATCDSSRISPWNHGFCIDKCYGNKNKRWCDDICKRDDKYNFCPKPPPANGGGGGG